MIELKQRIYISGPITGVADYRERFGQAENECVKAGYTVINPAKLDDILPKGCSYEEILRLDLALLDMCDSIYMMQGWGKSPGANREYGYALASDKTIILQGVKE